MNKTICKVPTLLFSPAWYVKLNMELAEYSWVVDVQLSRITHGENKVTWEHICEGTLQPVNLLFLFFFVVCFFFFCIVSICLCGLRSGPLCFLLGAWKGWENNSNLILCYAWRVRTIRRSARQRKHHDSIMAPIHTISHAADSISAAVCCLIDCTLRVGLPM